MDTDKCRGIDVELVWADEAHYMDIKQRLESSLFGPIARFILGTEETEVNPRRCNKRKEVSMAMTVEQVRAKDKIDVMQAWINGKQIEFRVRGKTDWKDCAGPGWDWSCSEYRIKREDPIPMKLGQNETKELLARQADRINMLTAELIDANKRIDLLEASLERARERTELVYSKLLDHNHWHIKNKNDTV